MSIHHTSEITSRIRDNIENASDRAAGAIIVSKQSGKILIGERSDEVEHPNKLGIFGGRFDDFESPENALEREIFEETGYPIFGRYKPLSVYLSEDNAFVYHTHIAFAPTDFEPELNWEHADASWMSLEELKSIPKENLHHGIALLLDNTPSMTELTLITNHYMNKEQSVKSEPSHSY